MFKKTAVLAAVSAILLAPAAFATTVGLAYDNVRIDVGQGIDFTSPGGKLSIDQSLGAGYGISGDFVGASGGNDATFYGVRAKAYKAIPFDGGQFRPGLDLGYNRLSGDGSHAAAMYAGVDVFYRYPLNRNIALQVNAGFGRDFDTSVTDLNTIGGLTYTGGGGMDFRVGPGVLSAGYQYRHLPLSTAYDLHLNTGQFTIGYGMSF